MQHTYVYLIALAALAAGSAFAQTAPRPDPADPQARAPLPVYRSAFEGFRRLEDAQRPMWREANEEAARIGGHIGILREQMAREKAEQGERK
ncbi:MAG: hypothetical protein OEZ09_14475 [Betaproteobacteria bacterium]|nr:hypothetical protein [Betaproteobacteria bacterium]MDH5579650.1 hypothetical protein [Betaproteobacteria bacterium]